MSKQNYMNVLSDLEKDKLIIELQNSVQFLTEENIKSYKIIERLNNHCNFLSSKIAIMEDNCTERVINQLRQRHLKNISNNEKIYHFNLP
jgi:hypothetical protein